MNEPVSASVLIIGNEILSGKTQDANLQFLAGAFARLGIALAEARVVRDEHDVIAAVLNELGMPPTAVAKTPPTIAILKKDARGTSCVKS